MCSSRGRNKQPPESVEMLAKDQQEFGENVEKWVAGFTAPERTKAKKLLKRYACALVMNNRRQGRTDMVKHEITGEARPIKQAPRSIPLAKRNQVKELVDDMKRSSLIEKSAELTCSLTQEERWKYKILRRLQEAE